MNPDDLADVVARVLKAAIAPVVARVATLEGARDAAVADAAALRERVAVVEVKPLIPGPPGKDGANGVDGAHGRDGFDLKAFDVALDADLRTLLFTFGDGEQTKEARVKGAWFLDRGVYRDGQAYEPGDVVSWDGSAWVTSAATAARPGTTGSPWRLCVKRGRDGSR